MFTVLTASRDLDVTVLLADELVGILAAFVQYAYVEPLPREPLLPGGFIVSALVASFAAECASGFTATVQTESPSWLMMAHASIVRISKGPHARVVMQGAS